MISCTEFIPCYSELFTYLEEKVNRQEVENFWAYLFEPTGDSIPLINFVKKEGLRGCWSYWSGTLTEEAADSTMHFNAKRGYFYEVMHKCPSKGRLLQLENEIGLKPYHDYCLHCAYYKNSVEKVGLKYIYNFDGIDHAACSMLIYNPEIFDGRIIIDEDTQILKIRASENEYFHKDFHSSMNMGIEYVGKKFGLDGVREFLERYTKNVYCKEIEKIKVNGLDAIADLIKKTYKLEKSEDVLTLNKSENELKISIEYCPAVKHLKDTGREVSKWYKYTTEIVMETLAKIGDFNFNMEYYNEDTGETKYSFTK